MSTALRESRRREVAALAASPEVSAAIAFYGTPVLLLEPERVRQQYRRLHDALPFVRFHYALKALSHPRVVEVIREEGGCFDIASDTELELLRGVPVDRVIHTHPIKTPDEIARAVGQGVRMFVVDNPTELAKFAGYGSDVRLLVRLAYRSPGSKSDLSSKFGIDPRAAGSLVEAAIAQGTPVAGFSFHVGSQLDDPGRFRAAVAETLELMDALESRLPIRFTTLDIGGGFPVGYLEDVASIETIARAIRPLLEPRSSALDIIAEPGRILVAEAMTLVTSVTGVADRPDGRWYYIDDGVYGSYSNIVAEDVHPLVFTARELRDPDAPAGPHGTVAGPTCDSADVIARGVRLPELHPGDLLFSPAMGAYTAVTATDFNGRPRTPIVAVQVATEGPISMVALDTGTRHS